MRTFAIAGAVLLFGMPMVARADDAGKVWKTKCASCHGADGKAESAQAKKMKVADMTAADWQKKFSDDDIKKVITDGLKREKDGTKQEMKGFAEKLKAEEIDGLVKFIRGLK